MAECLALQVQAVMALLLLLQEAQLLELVVVAVAVVLMVVKQAHRAQVELVAVVLVELKMEQTQIAEHLEILIRVAVVVERVHQLAHHQGRAVQA
jgi:hypothetical protein